MATSAFVRTEGPIGPKGPGVYAIVTGAQPASTTTPEVLGVGSFELSENPSTLRVVASAPSGLTMNVRITDLTAGGVVLGTVVSTASTTPVALTMTFAPADATLRNYSIEGYLSGGIPGASSIGYCYNAYVEA